MTLTQIISGCQTGVDVAALRAAQAVGLATGGTMPKGFLTGDPNQPCHRDWAEQFGLSECKVKGYPARTKQNVMDADGTLVLIFRQSAGTALTLKYALGLRKPHLTLGMALDAEGAFAREYVRINLETNALEAYRTPRQFACETKEVGDWLTRYNVRTLNVAGNRGAHLEAPVEAWLIRLFTALKAGA